MKKVHIFVGTKPEYASKSTVVSITDGKDVYYLAPILWKPGEIVPDFDIMQDNWNEPQDVLEAIASAVVEAGHLDGQNGYLKGQLEATERHLQDMRSLAFPSTLKPK